MLRIDRLIVSIRGRGERAADQPAASVRARTRI